MQGPRNTNSPSPKNYNSLDDASSGLRNEANSSAPLKTSHIHLLDSSSPLSPNANERTALIASSPSTSSSQQMHHYAQNSNAAKHQLRRQSYSDAPGAAAPRTVHLLFLCHGNHGSELDFREVLKLLHRNYREDTWDILVSVANANNTHGGVESGGYKHSVELLDHIRTKYERYYEQGISIELYYVAHSLGGLYGRASLKYLAMSDEWKRRIIRPRSFITMCSPHLGSRRPGGTFKKNLWKLIAHTYCLFLGQTGRDLFLKSDQLYRMSHEDEYIVPLKEFEKLTLVSIPYWDMAVPYTAAAIRSYNPYPQPKRTKKSTHNMEIVGYSGFSRERCLKLFMNTHPNAKRMDREDIAHEFIPHRIHEDRDLHSDNVRHVAFSKKMLYNLNQLPWRRIDVQFNVRSVIDQFKVHELVLAKQKLKRLRTESMLENGRKFVNGYLSQIIWYDRIHSRDFMRDVWKNDQLNSQDMEIICQK